MLHTAERFRVNLSRQYAIVAAAAAATAHHARNQQQHRPPQQSIASRRTQKCMHVPFCYYMARNIIIICPIAIT